MVSIKEITTNFPKKYICVHNTMLDEDNLIVTAEIIRVYDTLDIAKDHASEIRSMMKRYRDFDIIYGDYEDYVRTRKGKKVDNHIVSLSNKEEKLSQENIDELIRMYLGASMEKKE